MPRVTHMKKPLRISGMPYASILRDADLTIEEFIELMK